MKASKYLLIAVLALCVLPMLPTASAEAGDMRLLATYHVDGAGRGIAWSPDGTRLVATSGNNALVLSTADGSELFNLTPETSDRILTGVQWAPNGSQIFTSYSYGAGAGEVVRWDALTGSRLGKVGLAGGETMAISPDGRSIAGSGGDLGKTLSVRNIDDGSLVLETWFPMIEAVAWSPDSLRLACLEGPRNLSVWNLSDGSHLNCDLEPNRIDATCICYSPDGDFLMTGVEFRDPGMIANIAPWDSKTGIGWGALFCNNSNTVSLAWAPDGRLALGQRDGSIFFTGLTREAGWVNSDFLGCNTGSVDLLAWSPDGKLLASGSPDGTIRLWGASLPPPPPPRNFELSFSAERAQAISGQTVNLTVRLLDGARAPVLGASVSFNSSAGGSFSAATDAGDGNYTARFTLPAVQANLTVIVAVNASKTGFEAANRSLQLLVLPVPPPVQPRLSEPAVHTDDNTGAIVAVAGGALVLVAAALAITEAGKYSGMFLVIPLYTRMKKTAVLDNFSRGQLHGYVVANPGVHMNAIRDRFGLSNGEVAYHLRVLEREGLVSSQSDGLKRRFYPGEGGARERPQELTFAQNLLISLMEKTPGITGTELAHLTDTSPQVVNYHLKRLWRMELITMDRDGRVVRCFVRPEKLGLFKRAAENKEALPDGNLSWDPA